MSSSGVKIITTIEFSSTTYSLSYDISDNFSYSRISRMIALCEHAIMHEYCNYLGISNMPTKHYLPFTRSAIVTFRDCPLYVVEKAAKRISMIIDADDIERNTIDNRFSRINSNIHKNTKKFYESKPIRGIKNHLTRM